MSQSAGAPAFGRISKFLQRPFCCTKGSPAKSTGPEETSARRLMQRGTRYMEIDFVCVWVQTSVVGVPGTPTELTQL